MAIGGPSNIECSTRSILIHAAIRNIFLILTFVTLFPSSSALKYVPGSPCEEICSKDKVGDIGRDVVCTDDQYKTTPGSYVRDCTTCLLNSTAVDSDTSQSDVLWALWNFRYTLSECMFAYPREIVSISSPCQVTCQKVANATTFGITASSGNETTDLSQSLDFCSHGFSDLDINNCAFCYSFIPQQLFLANFLQALHIACRQNPIAGQSFYPNGQAIFNESAIAGPAPPSANGGGGSGLTGWKLALVIALPIVGGTVLFAGTCFCCFRFTRHRRQKMAATGRMTRFHDNMVPPSPVTAKSSRMNWETQVSQQEVAMAEYEHNVQAGKQPSPGYSQGRFGHGEVEGTPSSAIFPAQARDDVGPGSGQQQDPYLHEQYFGVAHGGAESVAGSSYYDGTAGDRRSWQ